MNSNRKGHNNKNDIFETNPTTVNVTVTDTLKFY